MQAAEFEQMRCNNKMRFILAVVAGKLRISNCKRADIEEQLGSDGYDRMPNRAVTVITLRANLLKELVHCFIHIGAASPGVLI